MADDARRQLLERMDAGWQELETVVSRLEGRMDAEVGDGWRAEDLLAHIALWERVARWKVTGDPVPGAEDLAAMEPFDLNRFNQTMRERWRDRGSDAVLMELRSAHAALVATVEAADDASCAPGGKAWTVIDEDGAGHYGDHLGALRAVITGDALID